jgi:hypothetical protein
MIVMKRGLSHRNPSSHQKLDLSGSTWLTASMMKCSFVPLSLRASLPKGSSLHVVLGHAAAPSSVKDRQ